MGTTRTRLRLPSPALILACVALFAALGGGAYAASSIGSKGIHFTNVKLEHGWIDASKTNHVYASPGYAKDSLGVVHLRGGLSSGPNDTVAFVLPKAARPSHTIDIPVFTASSAMGTISIDSKGRALLFGGNATAFTVLDGVSFVAGE
jgi:hypothetical protein